MKDLEERHAIKCLSRWLDLEQYGIIALTGESCSLTMRLLCDVTGSGKELLERFLGGSVTIHTGSNWNSSKGAVGSVMLSYGMLTELMAFALHLREKFNLIVSTKNGCVIGVNWREVESYLKEAGGKMTDWNELVTLCYGEIDRRWACMEGAVGGRNVHQFSGRVE